MQGVDSCEPSSRPGFAVRPSETIPGSNFVIPADMVVKALGQEPLLELVAALPDLKCGDQGRTVVSVPPARPASPSCSPAAIVSEPAARSSRPSRTARLRPGGSTRRRRLLKPGKRSRRRADSEGDMTDLSIEFCGVKVRQSFLAGLGTADQLRISGSSRFEAGWGGAVWKTLAGEPIVNVSSPRRRHRLRRPKVMGLNNIELITDRPLEVNLEGDLSGQERFPRSGTFRVADGRVEAGGMARDHQEDTGRRADGIELNFGCPHGMSGTRHGLGGGPGSGLRVHDHRVGQDRSRPFR